MESACEGGCGDTGFQFKLQRNGKIILGIRKAVPPHIILNFFDLVILDVYQGIGSES